MQCSSPPWNGFSVYASDRLVSFQLSPCLGSKHVSISNLCKMLKGTKTHIRIYSDLHKIQTATVFVKRQTVLYTENCILCANWSGNRAFLFLMSSCTCWHIAGRRCLCLWIRRLFQLDHCGSKLTPRRLTVICNIWPMSNPLMTRNRLVLFSTIVRLKS